MVTAESVKQGIQDGLACEHLEVIGDGQHFQALVVSEQFAGRSRVQRHQLVYAALAVSVVGLLAAPVITGLKFTPVFEWIAALTGVAAGWLLAHQFRVPRSAFRL